MKTILTLVFFLILQLAQGQVKYFQREFNLNYVTPVFRNERFNSGIRTQHNFDANNAFYYVGIGTSYKNSALAAPNNTADRLRFTRLSTSSAVLSNRSHQYSRDGKALNTHANSIAEIRVAGGNGGYIAVGEVASNPVTGAVAAGGSDVLFTNLNFNGFVVNSSRIDIAGGNDIAWSVKRSNILVGGQPTWIICGESKRGTTHTDCFVARVTSAGAIIWCNRFNFDPGGGMFTSAHCIAKQLVEDANGNIYLVGTLQDNSGNNGIDGLAFKLGAGGNLIWANNYHLASDDEFQAVRLTVDNNLIVGGFTNFTGMYHMQITKLTAAAGAIQFQNILRARNGNNLYPSKCYDILEALGPNYYLAGLVNQAGVNREMMYRAGAGGIGINWNSYNAMFFNVGFGIHYVPDDNCPGIAYFSSLKNTNNPAFSDGHIMKTDLTTRTCNFLFPKDPSNLASNLVRYARLRRMQPSGSVAGLTSTTITYTDKQICKVDCVSPASASIISPNASELIEPSASIKKLKLAPNPVSQTLHIEATFLPAGEYQLELKDMLHGSITLRKTIKQSKGTLATDLDLSNVAPGVYLLTIKSGNLVLQERVMKQ
ncbi:T9SS type A sorting domain-containing protein [Adhaeribacter radiodurans]|uniref:T9SS type A sorting domain-containing protein n=1 Tax=Adhaeribacter radiodurans TaxID=2745197 RepID=A0A7L7LA58_9BACT|nr:T9SS type A sorting domain-containing protein [Adhaeribacter radiodurans]QMU29289.1 T9SS type A sorting domain-containing protein [Adhaeribacter radiodurans]